MSKVLIRDSNYRVERTYEVGTNGSEMERRKNEKRRKS
jgi:hypothetical protein